MSTNIYGWIEIGDSDEEDLWDGIIKASHIMGQNYDLFTYLFGVRNKFECEPIASHRGLPADISPEAKEDHQQFIGEDLRGWSESWVGWWELNSIDWKRQDDGTWTTADGKVAIYWDWQLVLNLMGQLAERWGTKYVRQVVWFG